CGYEVVTIPSDTAGNMDIDALRTACNEETVGLILTLPNTLGLFDNNILEICKLVHDCGGLVYGDGANMNAMLGRTKLGDLGFDVMHFNLHKTFSTPHGGGGPGSGPVCARDILVPFLPSPVIRRDTDEELDSYSLDEPDTSIGKTSAFHGNFGMLVRAYTYINLLGANGLLEVSENAVLNANYILANLKDYYNLPYDRVCMHEVVFSAKNQKQQSVSALDIAKRLIDYGIHPPTMYFPLIVEEALMIEPTETESKETIDKFIQVMQIIAQEVLDDPLLLKNAPHSTPNTRLDEAKAARNPDLRWHLSS
ncbi:MAG: aminomethyl-transferring glycine dehydrogenase subunit GcvPB, partial [Dehalococcoidia bacterium]|nr:aminomethyl-transferring glycine dehydrogenase subunit GcvPB [Dehalococcoidia bacterium]